MKKTKRNTDSKKTRDLAYGFYAHSVATCLGGGEGEFRWFASVAEAVKELLDFSDTCGATDVLGDDEGAGEDDMFAEDRTRFKQLRAARNPNEDDVAYLAEFISSGDVENIAWYGWERDLLTADGSVPEALRAWFRAKRDDGEIIEPGSDEPIRPEEEAAFWEMFDSGEFVLEE